MITSTGRFTRVDIISEIFLLEYLNMCAHFRHNKIRVTGIAFYLYTSAESEMVCVMNFSKVNFGT